MEKSTVIEILKTFSKEELGQFDDFCSSPYHNKKTNVTKLFKALRKLAPDFPAGKITKEEIWKKVFPGKTYNYGIMKNLIYDLNKLAVKFIELEIYSQKTFEHDINQLDAYKKRDLKQLFIKKTTEARNKLQVSPLDNQTYYKKYLLNCTEMSFLDYTYLYSGNIHSRFDEINDSLLLFCYTNQLYHTVNNIQFSFNVSTKGISAASMQAIEMYENSPGRVPYADILFYACKAFLGPADEAAYEKLKSVFLEHYKKCAGPLQYDLAAMMINFCRNNAQRGNTQFIKDEFFYIELIIANKLYEEATFGWMDQYMFMQAVMGASRVGKYDWAEKFIEDHHHLLKEDIREQYTNYAYISLNLKRGNYKEALGYIAKLKNVWKGDRLNIKVFELNAYYELGYYDELRSLADTTSHFLKSDKYFTQSDKTSYKNYVTAISWLMDRKCGVGKKQSDANFLDVVTDFINKNPIRNKLWLLQKIDELKVQREN